MNVTNLLRFLSKTALRLPVFVCVAALTLSSASPLYSSNGKGSQDNPTPVVLFPGMFGSQLLATVDNQTSFHECPSSGTFLVFAGDFSTFSSACQMKLITLVYDPDPRRPMPQRFSSHPGVTVTMVAYGNTESAPLYGEYGIGFYQALEAAGYQRNVNIRVAGYDSRLAPDMGGFLEQTVALIEQTYHDNGNTRVHLVGHSNGPVYAQYLLTHTSQQWKNKYIQGFTPLAGNFAGSGRMYSNFFTSYETDPELAKLSVAMWLSWPAAYMSVPDPKVIGNKEVVIRDLSTGKSYTPKDYRQLFRDAGLDDWLEVAKYYIGFVEFATPRWFPYVDVYAEVGDGLPTGVGVEVTSLQTVQLLTYGDPTPWIIVPGDSMMAYLNSSAVTLWQKMHCYHFEFNNNTFDAVSNPFVDHFFLPVAPDVMGRLLQHLQQPASSCRPRNMSNEE